MCLIETHVPTSTLVEYVSFHVLFKTHQKIFAANIWFRSYRSNCPMCRAARARNFQVTYK